MQNGEAADLHAIARPRPQRRIPKFRRRAEARPDEVLEASLDLFIERGFSATRVEDIARRAGLSKGAVYLYFPSKEAILEALVRRAIVPITDMAAAALDRFEGTPREALQLLFGLMADQLADPRVIAIPKLIMREGPGPPTSADTPRPPAHHAQGVGVVGVSGGSGRRGG